MPIIHQVHIFMLILEDSMECIIESITQGARYQAIHDISTDQYYTLRLAKENTTTQTKSNSHFWLIRSILSGSVHSHHEAESLVSQIVTALHKIKDVFIILTSRLTDNQIVFPAFPRIIEIRAKKEFDETKLNLSIYNNSKMKRVALTENELNGVPA